MKKFSKKSVMLFAAAMALCAFAMPSMASAATFGPANSEHTLDAVGIGFINHTASVSSDCATAQFTADVVSGNLEITSSAFRNCAAAGAVGNCTVSSTGTNFPWTATARTTSDIQIHGVNIAVVFQNHPGLTTCGAAGVPLRITGTLVGGRWTGNAIKEVDLPLGGAPNGASGLFSHSALGNNTPLTLTGTIFDTQNTLVVN